MVNGTESLHAKLGVVNRRGDHQHQIWAHVVFMSLIGAYTQGKRGLLIYGPLIYKWTQGHAIVPDDD